MDGWTEKSMKKNNQSVTSQSVNLSSVFSSLSPTLSFSLFLSLFSPSLCHFPSQSLCLSLSLIISFYACLSLSLIISFYACLSLSLIISFYACLSLSLIISFYACLSLSLIISFYACLSLSLIISFYACLSLSLTENVSPRIHGSALCIVQSGRVVYEKRVYQKATWACITMREDTYEQSICVGFMKLMRYICKQNTLGIYLGMTLPIVTVVMTDDSRSRLSREVRVGYYLPSHHQDHPPMPFDPDITMETWPTTVVYSRPFSGPTTVTSILEEIHGLAEVLDSPELYVNNCFIIAGYTSLAAAHRHNEVWFLEHC
uniref:Heme-binding protein soul5, like n=1 Tax=Esox lucius TaxID=8010 RepID=A0A6Q2XPT5_ESOLU